MGRVNHSSMTDQKLKKRYVLDHQDNNEAFYVYF